MKEYGGYLEFERYYGLEYHEEGIALNSGRNCLRYLIEGKHINKIALPEYICSSVINACRSEKVEISYYEIDMNFKPILNEVKEDIYIYIVNYFGQLSDNYLSELCQMYSHIIIDNSQAFYAKAIPNVDTIYTCRKFFGVCEGAYLYTDCTLNKEMVYDRVYDRMEFLLGRFECGAQAFFNTYQKNEDFISNQEIKYMSPLTRNILKSLSYEKIRERRNRNFNILEEAFGDKNILNLSAPKGAYMYPLLIHDGKNIRHQLIEKGIYIPLLWPNILDNLNQDSRSYYLANNILPLPCDQRYVDEDMQYIIKVVNYLLAKMNPSG